MSDTVMAALAPAAARAVPLAATAASPLIRMEGVTKTYDAGELAVTAHAGIDLAIEKGQMVAIIGPSGSGKSMLMHILGCLDAPSSGSYRLDGRDVAMLSGFQLAAIRNQKIGFVFQTFNLLPKASLLRNVELPLLYANVPAAVRKERAMAALGRVGLADRTANRPGELSGGQQQRAAVARAIVGDPAMILADEPTGNLDSVSTADVLALFDELHGQGRTVVLITHELEVAEHARRIVRVRDGRIWSDEVNAHPRSARFGEGGAL